MEQYIIGFDADTKRCGLVIVNCETGIIEEVICQPLTEIAFDFLPKFTKKYKGTMFSFRIEMPTLRTAIGVNNFDKGTENAKEGIYHSGRCSEIATQFKEMIEYFGFPYETVKSQNRVRCDTLATRGLTSSQIEQFALNHFKSRKFLSKLDRARAALVFDGTYLINEEVIDAALLCLPEILAARKK